MYVFVISTKKAEFFQNILKSEKIGIFRTKKQLANRKRQNLERFQHCHLVSYLLEIVSDKVNVSIVALFWH